MPFDNFSLGKDVVIDVVTPLGPLQLPVTVTSFDSKPRYKTISSTGLDGKTRQVKVPDGWEGTIGLDRRNNAVDLFFAQMEAGYYSGANLTSSTITETITESDGSLSQYQYTGVTLSFDNAGKKEGDNKIEQTIGFFASTRELLS